MIRLRPKIAWVSQGSAGGVDDGQPGPWRPGSPGSPGRTPGRNEKFNLEIFTTRRARAHQWGPLEDRCPLCTKLRNPSGEGQVRPAWCSSTWSTIELPAQATVATVVSKVPTHQTAYHQTCTAILLYLFRHAAVPPSFLIRAPRDGRNVSQPVPRFSMAGHRTLENPPTLLQVRLSGHHSPEVSSLRVSTRCNTQSLHVSSQLVAYCLECISHLGGGVTFAPSVLLRRVHVQLDESAAVGLITALRHSSTTGRFIL